MTKAKVTIYDNTVVVVIVSDPDLDKIRQRWDVKTVEVITDTKEINK